MTDADHIEKHGRGLEVHRKSPGGLYAVDDCETRCRDCHYGQPKRKRGTADLEGGLNQKRSFQLTPDLVAALERLVSESKPQVSESAVLRLALGQFLERKGYLPS